MAVVKGPSPDYPFKVECLNDPNCLFAVTFKTYAEALEWDKPAKHGCPRRGETLLGASVTQSLLEQAWTILDQHMGIVQSFAKDHPERKIWMARCRGVAEVIALFMVPHFRTADEVAREAMKRWDDAQNGKEHRTPGLGTLKYTFPDDVKYRSPLAQAAQQRERANKGLEPVDDKTKEDMLIMKAFATPEQIAEAFSLSVETVKRVLQESS